MKRSEDKGFYIGLLVGIPLGVLLVKSINKTKFKMNWLGQAFVPLFSGSLMYWIVIIRYGAWTFSSKRAYTETAAKINRKYSQILNKTINYWS